MTAQYIDPAGIDAAMLSGECHNNSMRSTNSISAHDPVEIIMGTAIASISPMPHRRIQKLRQFIKKLLIKTPAC